MAAPIVFCQGCGVGYACVGDLPPTCPKCDTPEPAWSSMRPLKLSANDRKFLKSLRIRTDD